MTKEQQPSSLPPLPLFTPPQIHIFIPDDLCLPPPLQAALYTELTAALRSLKPTKADIASIGNSLLRYLDAGTAEPQTLACSFVRMLADHIAPTTEEMCVVEGAAAAAAGEEAVPPERRELMREQMGERRKGIFYLVDWLFMNAK